jgi:hypothetical protein
MEECRWLGYVPEEPHLYGYLTGLEYLELARRRALGADLGGKTGGAGESAWWLLASRRAEVILLSAGSMLTCQFLFWSGIVERENTRRADESGPRRR